MIDRVVQLPTQTQLFEILLRYNYQKKAKFTRGHALEPLARFQNK